jgi:uncharacterized protein (TIGR01777 family)
MKIVVAGASGLVGTALVAALQRDGHVVHRLVRRAAKTADEITWDPARGEIDRRRIDGVDAVVNLAGENLGAGRWTEARRGRIFRSRIDATRTLVAAMLGVATRPTVFLSASAVGFYGDRGDDVVTESSGPGRGFLPEVCQAWEGAAQRAEEAGVRTVRLRFGVVLAAEGGALAKMLPLFRLGLGGPLGSGRQWMSWISLEDAVGAIRHALRDERVRGPVNVVAPGPVKNADFTRELARAVRRPAFLPAPAWALRFVLGKGMADEALLGSTRAEPRVLERTGYAFRHPTLAAALQG